MTKATVILTATMLALLTACSSGDGTAKTQEAKVGGKKEEAKAGEEAKEAAPAPAAKAWKQFNEMKVQIEVPGDANLEENKMDDWNGSANWGDYAHQLDVSTVTEAYPSDFDAAKKSIEGDPNPFQKFTKEEKTDDGWHLEYELKSMMDPNRTLYGVQIRKTIGEKQYECGRNVDSADERALVAEVCASLKGV
ncbi:MAG: hypothetical protein KC636_00250 [Myxococcales bacterium]|nr:hypothetical protein [Myxococcales bacterium]